MSDEEAFLRAIADDLTNDTPRLIYADWLDENGRPERAEFIRLQCAVAHDPPGAPSHHLRKRADELRDFAFRHGDRRVRIEHSRGLPNSVYIDNDAAIPLLAELIHYFPWVRIELIPGERGVEEFLALPNLEQVRRLKIQTRFGSGTRALTRLLASPRLSGLESFTLVGTHFDAASAAYLGQNVALSGLKSLTLETTSDLEPFAWTIRRSAVLSNLRTLRLLAMNIGTTVLSDCLSGPQRWRELEIGIARSSLHDHIVDTLANAETLNSLEKLRLVGVEVRGEGFHRLLRRIGGSLIDLEIMNQSLHGNSLLGSNGLDALPRLERLAVILCSFVAEDFRAILRLQLPRLRVLILNQNPLGSSGMTALRHAAISRQLTHLDLANTELHHGLADLTCNEELTGLRWLNLSFNRFSDAGAAALVRANWATGLEVLDLRQTSLTLAGIALLFACDRFRNLRWLGLSDLRLDPQMMQRLIAESRLPDECLVQYVDSRRPIRVSDVR